MKSMIQRRAYAPTSPVPTGYGASIIEDVHTAYGASSPDSNYRSVREHSFGIHLANTDASLESVSVLINRRYAWRGYTGSHHVDANPGRITLAAAGQGKVFGTVTLNTDSSSGFMADATFKSEIDAYRARGAKVCEVTKLALDPEAHPKLALASLFHTVYLCARKIHKCTDAIIEVNPRHCRYYENMLGFERATEVRHNARVSAPAYLLRLSLEYMGTQIEKLAGTAGGAGLERSLYPYFFDRAAEIDITERLQVII